MWCLPVHTVVTSGAGATFHVAVFIPMFLATFTVAVALATRYRTSTRVAPIVAVGAIVAGVLLARGGVQREIFVVAHLPAPRAPRRRAGVPRLARAGRRLVPDGRARPRGGVRRRGRRAAGLGPAAHRADAGVLRGLDGEPRGLRVDDGRRGRAPGGGARPMGPARGDRHAVDPRRHGRRGRARPAGRGPRPPRVAPGADRQRGGRRPGVRVHAARATDPVAGRQARHRSRGRPTRPRPRRTQRLAGARSRGGPRRAAVAPRTSPRSGALRAGGLVADPVHAPAHPRVGRDRTGDRSAGRRRLERRPRRTAARPDEDRPPRTAGGPRPALVRRGRDGARAAAAW